VVIDNQKLKVAYLGPSATFTNEAAIKHFGDTADYLPLRAISDVFGAVALQEADYGLVPVENALEGVVTYTVDMFMRPDMQNIQVCAEIFLPISHNFMVAPAGAKNLSEIEIVYSHPQSFAQCQGWMRTNLPNVETLEVTSNSRAAELAAQNLKSAAIGPRLAAQHYGLKIIAKDLQDADFNQTRFFVIAANTKSLPETSRNGLPVASVMISIKDRVGALHAVTSVFTRYNLNMNRIESRPSKQKAWDYVFFIEFVGHPDQPHVAAALAELEDETVSVRLLGKWFRVED
jgi:chorismate mutase / prephenate dehydratase